MHQTYVILDNSTDKNKINEIRQVCKNHPGTEWIRDVPNHHAKAGNLDNYLCHEGKGTYDYFVILDSDEMIQPDFVKNCLKFFYYSHHLGILQCNHISGRNSNAFMDIFSHSGNSFWPVQNAGDTVAIGLGHGVMVSRPCFEAIGKFPYMVAEDLCSSCEAFLKGWNIKFATQIYGNEEFPVNMEALMTRSSKFCSANFQFFTAKIRFIVIHFKRPVIRFYVFEFDLMQYYFSVRPCPDGI
ncbi:MAG: glycosyltransferase family 2 protein [Acetilactobacillus jinshanensis]